MSPCMPFTCLHVCMLQPTRLSRDGPGRSTGALSAGEAVRKAQGASVGPWARAPALAVGIDGRLRCKRLV